MKYENMKNYSASRFRQVTGVLPETFDVMVNELKKQAEQQQKKVAGRPRALAIEDQLLMTLEYYREYRSYDCIAASYGVGKGTVSRTINWVENVLVKSGLFNLPGKKALTKNTSEIEVIVVDSTETPIERPKNGQRKYYSGKKNDIR